LGVPDRNERFLSDAEAVRADFDLGFMLRSSGVPPVD
jgi:hypothetical protein